MKSVTLKAEVLAEALHTAYERLAPSFGYETRPDSAVPWAGVPLMNKRLMIAAVTEALAAVTSTNNEACTCRGGIDAYGYAWHDSTACPIHGRFA